MADAVQNVESLLRNLGITFESRFLPEVVLALFFGSYAGCVNSFDSVALDCEKFLSNAKQEVWGEIAKLHGRAA